jgi:hypothetical protein
MKKHSTQSSKDKAPHPFLFSNRATEEDECSTSSSYLKQGQDQSFLRELSKIGIKNLTILEQNPVKTKFSPSGSPSARFPYQRKARSISPPKDVLAVSEKTQKFFFPAGSPVVPDNSLHGDPPNEEKTEDDDKDLLELKQQYLKLIQQAPNLNFKSELFDQDDDLSGTEEFNEWESSIMKKMQLH